MSEQTRPNGRVAEQRPTDDKANGQPTTRESTSKATDQHVTVADAALLLGLSEDAVRSRLRRGTLRRETGRDGTVFVVLGNDRPVANQRPTDGRPTDQHTTDRPTGGHGSRGGASEADRAELVDVLRDEVEHLRGQLEAERTASSELRRIVAGLVQRVPEIEALETSLETRDEPLEDAEPLLRTEGGQEAKGHRPSWWRRFFGFE